MARPFRKRPRARPPSRMPVYGFVVISLCLGLLFAQVVVTHSQAQQTTCSLGGKLFLAGQTLGDQFTTRCGSAAEFPCFCKPDASPPMDCPYCGIATQDNAKGLVCATVGGPPVNVTTLAGVAKVCSCLASVSGTPESICAPVSASNNIPTAAPVTSSPANNKECTFQSADGSTYIFQNGESYGSLFTTPCGPTSQYPCFCNVSVPGNVYCPYCALATNTTASHVACGRIGETFLSTNTSDVPVACSCSGDFQAQCRAALPMAPSPIPTATPTLPPTVRPSIVQQKQTNAPILAPTLVVFSPTIPPTVASFPTPSPTTATQAPTSLPTPQMTMTPSPSSGLPTVNKPSIIMPSRNPPIALPVAPGCKVFDPTTAREELVAAGQALNSQIMQGPCSPSASYPVLCNPVLPGGVEYPYCVFTKNGQWSRGSNSSSNSSTSTRGGASSSRAAAPVGSGGGRSAITASSAIASDTFVVCAKNGDRVSVPTSQGTIASCSCLYLNPFIGPVSSCPDLLVTIPLALTSSSSPSLLSGPSTAPSSSPTSTSIPTEPPTTSSSAASPLSVAHLHWSVLLLLHGLRNWRR